MNNFCTITTYSHLYKVYALAESLKAIGHKYVMHVLVVDSEEALQFDNCIFYKLNQVSDTEVAKEIVAKYRKDKDRLRWALKSVFMHALLRTPECEKLVYLDNDILFYSDYDFLFESLNKYSFLLTPHHYLNDPRHKQNWLEANFRVGLYNAGFIGANRKGLKILQWWADCCAYRCEKNALRGIFDDQKYLDLIPVMYENAHILRHRGCNVAGWNIELCPRSEKHGHIYLGGTDRLVFIHYNDLTVRRIFWGEDELLKPYYERYEELLRRFKPDLKRTDLLKPVPRLDHIKYVIWKFVTELGF